MILFQRDLRCPSAEYPYTIEDAAPPRVKELEQKVHDLETEVKVLRSVVGKKDRF